jgi:transcription-repair coupling factor (superfamily II helicase)
MARTMPPELMKSLAVTLEIGGQVDLKELTDQLLSAGYVRCEQVEGVGQFALRGGILDVFSPLMEQPVRCEFFDDEIDSMGTFDPGTQRRSANVETALLLPAGEVLPRCAEGGTEGLGEKLLKLARKQNNEKHRRVDGDENKGTDNGGSKDRRSIHQRFDGLKIKFQNDAFEHIAKGGKDGVEHVLAVVQMPCQKQRQHRQIDQGEFALVIIFQQHISALSVCTKQTKGRSARNQHHIYHTKDGNRANHISASASFYFLNSTSYYLWCQVFVIFRLLLTKVFFCVRITLDDSAEGFGRAFARPNFEEALENPVQSGAEGARFRYRNRISQAKGQSDTSFFVSAFVFPELSMDLSTVLFFYKGE